MTTNYTPSIAPLPDQYFHVSDFRPFDQTSESIPGLPTPPASSRASVPPTPSKNAIAGKKRSRGDLRDEDGGLNDATIHTAAISPRGEPVYGPGMTLVYPNDPSGHYTADAGTQSGTWLEDQLEKNAAAAALAAAQFVRPVMPSRKSQRISASIKTSNLPSEPQSQPTPRTPGTDTAIDEASRMLGISWSRMDQTESSRISQRAYMRWIDRHYPQLTAVELWFENKAIEAYLGKAANASNGCDEYYLWSHDLQQAVLVTRDPSELIMKLGQPQTLLAGTSERLIAASQSTDSVTISTPADMEID